MENLKRYSFYFVTSFIIRKYFLFLVLAVTFIGNGFFISFAEAESITEDYIVTEGIDATGDTGDSFSDSELVKLSIVDGQRIQSNGATWPQTSMYDENKYIEFIFNPDISLDANIENITLTHNFRRSGSLEKAKLEIWNGSSFVDQEISVGPNTTTDNNEIIDIYSYINTPDQINSLKVRFLAYRKEGANTKTSHDFIGLTVVYNTDSLEEGSFTKITQDIDIDTIWSKENNPYVIDSLINVLDGATLTILPGVVVKFDTGGELVVDGKIDVQGTKLDPIYFTSFLDDTVGGYNIDDGAMPNDTNKDGNISAPNFDLWEGIWGRVTIKNKTIGSSLNNIILKYSNYGLSIYDTPVSSDGMELDRPISLYRSNSNFNNLSTFGLNLYENSTSIIENSVINDGGSWAIGLYGGSVLELSKSKINSGGRTANVFENSSIVLDEVTIDSGENIGDGLRISGADSKLTMTNSTIINIFSGVSLDSGASASISDSTFSCADSCIGGNEADLLLTDSKLFGDDSIPEEGYKKYGISFHKTVYNGGSGGGDFDIPQDENEIEYLFEINNNEIYNFDFGIYGSGGDIKGINNSIHDNIIGASNLTIEDGGGVMDLKNNYWGDKSGPKNEISNPSGLGDVVSDNILFTPFLLDDPFVIKKKDPVILIPGITGTYLYKNYDDKKEIWPNVDQLVLSLTDSFLYDLSLNSDGSPYLDKPIITDDIIRGISLAGIHVFDKLIEELENNGGYVEEENLFVFPYDWRKSTTLNASLLKEKVDQIIIDTGTSKVDIIAHSMGGLLAKSYISDYGKENVDQLIFLGTPHLGAPKAFKALMYGDDMGYGLKFLKDMKISLLNSKTVKYISQNMPSVYELLPSKKYVEDNDSYVMSDSINLNYEETKNLMIEKGRNLGMFYFAKNLHDEVDELDLSGIETHNFVGCGTKTIGSFSIKQKRLWESSFFNLVDDIKIKYINGDETVPVKSASYLVGANIYFAKENTHGSLPSAEGVRQNILSILKGETLQDFPNILEDSSNCNISGKVVSTHSPVELHIYDEDGNHTGLNSEGDIEYGIEGVNFDVLEGENYAFLPDNTNYKIITKATNTGGYDLIIEDQNDNDEITASYNWNLIPLRNINSNGEIWVGPTYSPLEYSVQMDDNGDGIFDQNYNINYDGTKEAEEATGTKNDSSGGSILKNVETKENFEEILIENFVNKPIEITFNDKNLKDKVIKENVEIKNEIINEYGTQEQNLYTASVGGFDAKSNTFWLIVSISGVILLVLAKIFIKL